MGQAYTREELFAALLESVQYWQAVLRLQDWNIVLVLHRKADMSIDGAIGASTYSLTHKDERLELVDPEDLYLFHQRFNGEELDYEVTLVHELLHLHFAPFMSDDEKSTDSMYQELAINTLARSLVALDRK